MERALTAIAALLLAGSAVAQDGARVSPPPVVATIPDDATLVFGDAQTRMTVPVLIDTRGPWNFVVDTGAERTVIARELAAALGLPAGPTVRVVTMSGAAQVPTVTIPSIAVSRATHGAILAPALAARDLGALGMVGIDALQDHVVAIDFTRGIMTLAPSTRRARARIGAGDVVVRAKSFYGQLIVTDAAWRGRRIAVVVDTGTPISVGNGALLRLMTNARSAGTVSLISATGGVLAAGAVAVNGIEIGGIGFANLTIAIADAAPFRRFGLTDTPALLMGMDLLRLFRMVRIDFANREIRFTLPRGAIVPGPAVNRP